MHLTSEYSTWVTTLTGTDLHIFSRRPLRPQNQRAAHVWKRFLRRFFRVTHPQRLRFRERISAILFAVRNSVLVILFLLAAGAVAVGSPGASIADPIALQATAPAGPQTPPPLTQASPPGQPPPGAPQSQSVPPKPPTPAVSGFVVVLDPAHGGTDTGARGANGIVEKDVVLQFARNARADLERQGYRVVMTRNDDSNPSYDDRAATANAYRDAIFISLHVSSTGTVGVARAYYYQFWAPFSPSAAPAPSSVTPAAPIPVPHPLRSELAVWQEAQRPYNDFSRRLADGLQLQLDQLFAGSPSASAGVEMRGLRSVTAPAVAVELSSVAVPQGDQLMKMAAPLASSIVKAVAAYRTGNAAGAK
jgi:N-acetylmuramoyl-L-alanine amidase